MFRHGFRAGDFLMLLPLRATALMVLLPLLATIVLILCSLQAAQHKLPPTNALIWFRRWGSPLSLIQTSTLSHLLAPVGMLGVELKFPLPDLIRGWQISS